MANENILLINRDDCMRLTSMNGNIDTTKLLPQIRTAQDVHLQPIIGTALYDELKQMVKDLNDSGTPIPADYSLLLSVYITPTLAYYTMWDFLPFLSYELRNGGIYKHGSENSEPASDEAMNMLVQRFKDKAEFYAGRLTSYLCNNSSLYPEFNQATNSELAARGNDSFHGIQL